MKDINTFRGCMLGGAAGDALGYAVEFIRLKEILKRYGSKGITEYDLNPADHTAHISDDTQMTLFTAGGLLTGRAMGAVLGYKEHIYRAYMDWYKAQYGEGLEADETVFGSTWLFRVPVMNYQRHPGTTCMSALGSGEKGSIDSPINNSKGCGGVMRVAPVGLFFEPSDAASSDSERIGKDLLPPEQIDLIGAESAALTHGHELGWLPAALLTRIISNITWSDGYSIPSKSSDAAALPAQEKKEELCRLIFASMEALQAEFAKCENTGVLCGLIKKACDLASQDISDTDAINQLGEGWVADEALAVAVYCAVKYADDFEKCLIAAVNHNGDSDSTGAIAGNILGAFLGAEAIPSKFIDNLEIKNVIADIADDLYTVCRPVGDDLWTAKYVMNNYKI